VTTHHKLTGVLNQQVCYETTRNTPELKQHGTVPLMLNQGERRLPLRDFDKAMSGCRRSNITLRQINEVSMTWVARSHASTLQSLQNTSILFGNNQSWRNGSGQWIDNLHWGSGWIMSRRLLRAQFQMLFLVNLSC
jgi:hypothetical protein